MNAETQARALAALTLSNQQLEQVRDELAQQIAQGLAQDGQTIKALPSYMRRPSGNAQGDVVVVDEARRAPVAVFAEGRLAWLAAEAAGRMG